MWVGFLLGVLVGESDGDDEVDEPKNSELAVNYSTSSGTGRRLFLETAAWAITTNASLRSTLTSAAASQELHSLLISRSSGSIEQLTLTRLTLAPEQQKLELAVARVFYLFMSGS